MKEFGNHIFKINLNFQFSGLELAHESLEGLRSTSLLSMKKLVVSKHKANVMSQSKGFMLLLLTVDFCSHTSDAKLWPIILTLKYEIGFINKYCKSAVI